LSVGVGVLSVLKRLLHRRFLLGELLSIVWLNDPPREGKRNGMNRRARRGLDGDRDRHDARQLSRHRADAIEIVALVVVLLVADFVHRIPAGCNAVHLRLSVELRHRQVAGFRRAACPDANELTDRDQSAAQDGDREDHLQQG
jgi:hypothetical protein